MSDNEQVDPQAEENPEVQPEEQVVEEGEDIKQNAEEPKLEEPNEPKPEDENPDGEKKEGEEGEEGEKKIIEPPEPDVELPTLNLAEDKKRTMRIIKRGLSKIQKVNDNSGYAFTEMNVENKEILGLYDILSLYPHVRYANISNNKINDISTVDMMPYLLQLNASKNLIQNMKVFTYQKLFYVIELDLSNNKITRIPGIVLPCLRKLNLNENQIDNCDEFRGHGKLETLSLRKNKLRICKIRNMPNLQDLDVSENEIEHFYDISNTPNLKNLNLKKNKIAALEKNLPALPNLQTLNLEENQMTDASHLKRLSELPALKTFLCVSNPMNEEIGDNLKKMLIKMFLPKPKPSDVAELGKKGTPAMVPDLKLVNEDEVAQEDKDALWEESVEEEKKRIEEEEARRLEEEERRKQEEEDRRRREEEAAAAAEAEAEAERERQKELAQKEAAENKGAEGEEPQEE